MGTVRRRLASLGDRLASGLPTWAGVVVVGLVFLFAVRLLGTATGALTPELERVLGSVLVSDRSALGLGWLAAAVLGNGTVVAAVSLSLHAAGLVTVPHLFFLVVGSRLGAAGVVLFIGSLDHLRNRRATVGKSLELGLLAAGLTASVYLPTAVSGAVLWRSGTVTGELDRPPVGVEGAPGLAVPSVFEPVSTAMTRWVGPPLAVLCAVVLVFVALDLADRVLAAADTERVRGRVTTWFDDRWLAATVGVVVTALTTSVAFSLGIAVPLYNRGYVTRREVVPYVLGANVGTLADTLAVAAVLGDTTAVAVVAAVGGLALGVTVVALVAFERYVRLVSVVLDRVLASAALTAAALAGFVGTPLLLVLSG